MAQLRKRTTIDEQFNAEYAKKGLQPSTGNSRVRKVNIQERKAVNDNFQPAANDNDRPVPPAQQRSRPVTQSAQRGYTRLKVKSKALPGEKADLKDRAIASAVNSSIGAWGIPLWGIVQLPFALFSNVFFAIAALMGAIFSEADEILDESGAVGKVVTWFVRGVAGAFKTLNEAIAAATGFNLIDMVTTALDPATYFFIFWVMIISIGIFMLLTQLLSYQMAGLKVLDGNGTTVKISALILMCIGYSTPFLNFFPWFILLSVAVWRYPK